MSEHQQESGEIPQTLEELMATSCLCCGAEITPETAPDPVPGRYGIGLFLNARHEADYLSKFQ